MKTLLVGVLLIILVGIGGVVYRNAAEHPNKPIVCPLDAKVCPDGTSVGRTGQSCTFPACPPPNVSLDSIGVAFAVPDGYASTTLPDPSSVAAYAASTTGTSSLPSMIVIRRYPLQASSTPLQIIQATAINQVSGQAVPATAFTSTNIGLHRFTVVTLERFEGVVDVAYYLARGSDVLRFDAVDRGVSRWSDPTLDVSTLPAQQALHHLLSTLQGGQQPS